MAVTRLYSGSLTIDPKFRQVLSGDGAGGSETPTLRTIETWYDDAASTDPTFAGWLYGTLDLTTGGDLLLAHATDPLQGKGDAVYSDGLDPAGKRIKLVYLRNLHATESFKIVKKAANGLGLFDATVGQTLAAGGRYLWEDPTGTVLAALSSGANDGLTISLPGAASSGSILVVYGT